jgi:dynein heavy chain
LLTTLEGAKSKAVEIAEKLDVSRATAREIEDARVRYRPVAVRGAALFFAMAGLASVNRMYEYSLASFLGVFNLVRRSSLRLD